jgi:HEAT repeat protein
MDRAWERGVLEGLEAVNWAALGHAGGSAEDVPWLLRQVRTADPKVREETLRELFSRIVHQGTRYSATAPAVPFLVELATAPDTPDRAWLVNLLAYAAVGNEEAVLPDGIVTLDRLRHTTNWHEPEYEAWALAAYRAVQAALPALPPLLDDDEDRLRRETAHLLAWFPSFAAVSLPRLRARLPLEAERDTRVTMIVAIGLLAGATGQTTDTPWLSQLLAGPDAVLRWAAATALARLVPEHPPEAAVQELLGWLTDPPEDANPFALQANPDAFPSHDDMPFGEYALQTLVRPGPAARRRVTEVLLAKLHGASGAVAERLLWELMVVAFGGDPQAPRQLFAGLDPLQQRIVGALARMPWSWQAPPGEQIPADNPLWAYGLPNTQQGPQAYVSDAGPT